MKTVEYCTKCKSWEEMEFDITNIKCFGFSAFYVNGPCPKCKHQNVHFLDVHEQQKYMRKEWTHGTVQ